MNRGKLTIAGYEEECAFLKLMHDRRDAQRDRHRKEDATLRLATDVSLKIFLTFIALICFSFFALLLHGNLP